MKYMKINKLILGTVIAFLFMGLLTSHTNAENTVKGTNVTKVEIGRAGTPVEYRLVQSGPKEWTQNHANGNLYVKYTETARDEWSVYLKSSRFSSVIINLWLKTFVMKEGSGVIYSGKVLSSSNTAITNANTNPTVSLEQQCFNAVQGKVAWNQSGSTSWGAPNVQKLCKGTTNPANTIACFKKEIQTHNSWSRGVDACKAGAGPVATVVTRAGSSPTVSTAEVDLSEVYGISPFPESYEKELFAWISAEVLAKRLPFCWRRSDGRGVGVVPTGTCAPGKVKQAGLCYTPCKAGYKGFANSCNAQCPDGYRDDGLFCKKPEPSTYIPQSYPLWDKDKCNARTPQGCHKLGLLYYPRCPTGYKQVALNCQALCPPGWGDIGISCTKPSYDRGVGVVTACATGMVADGGLCYKNCPRPGQDGVGPVCWQQCPTDRPFDCGAGCTLDEKTCGKDVANMVVSPILATVSLISLGTAGAAAQSAKAVATTTASVNGNVLGGAAAASSGLKITSNLLGRSPKLLAGLNALKAIKATPGFTLAFKASTMAVAAGAIKIPSITMKSIDAYQADYSQNFEKYTTPKVRQQIDRNFTPATAEFVKRKWALIHADLLTQASDFEKADIALTAVSIADPTGLVSVANAYKKPLCENTAPFPVSQRKY